MERIVGFLVIALLAVIGIGVLIALLPVILFVIGFALMLGLIFLIGRLFGACRFY